jgi:hypothetical protein
MTDDQIKHMVSRFLCWKLPSDFAPDGGVSFRSSYANEPMRSQCWPVGTNILTSIQAEEMVRHILDGLPTANE